MRFALYALTATLFGCLAAQAGDYRRTVVRQVVVRDVAPVYVAPNYYVPPARLAVGGHCDDYADVDVVPPLATVRRGLLVDRATYDYGFAARRVVVQNQFHNGYGFGNRQVVVQNRGVRRAGADGTGVVGVARAALGTVGNVLRAVVGR